MEVPFANHTPSPPGRMPGSTAGKMPAATLNTYNATRAALGAPHRGLKPHGYPQPIATRWNLFIVGSAAASATPVGAPPTRPCVRGGRRYVFTVVCMQTLERGVGTYLGPQLSARLIGAMEYVEQDLE